MTGIAGAALSIWLSLSPHPVRLPRPHVDRAWLALTAAQFGAAALDMNRTRNGNVAGTYENNPLARPFVRLPQPPYFAVGFAGSAGVAFIGLRMKRSHGWTRHVWWVPQAAQIGLDAWGFATSPHGGQCWTAQCLGKVK